MLDMLGFCGFGHHILQKQEVANPGEIHVLARETRRFFIFGYSINSPLLYQTAVSNLKGFLSIGEDNRLRVRWRLFFNRLRS